MTLGELRHRLKELEEHKDAITAELRALEEDAEERRQRAVGLGFLRGLVESGQSHDFKSPALKHKEYRQLGVRFDVDRHGNLTMRLEVDLARGGVASRNNSSTLCPPAAATSSARLA